MSRGMIGIASGDQMRYSQILSSIMGISWPEGTVFSQTVGFSVATNWNIIAKQFLSHPDNLEWLLLLEDDHLFPANTLMCLLKHNVDIVSALYVQRLIPFAPVMYDRVDEKGKVFYRPLKKGDSGLVAVNVCGGGCCLIRRKVFEAISPPWWFYGESSYLDACNHDINFCRKARAAGFQPYVDLDLPISHMITIGAIPFKDKDGIWHTRLEQGDKNITVGAAQYD